MILYFDNYDAARQAFEATAKAQGVYLTRAAGIERIYNKDGSISFRTRIMPQQVVTKKCCSCHE